LIIIAEAISERVLMKSFLSYINNHSLMKIMSREHSIEAYDPVTILWTVVKEIGQTTMVLLSHKFMS